MNESMELIKHIYQDSEMASYSIEELLKYLKDKDNKIKKYAQELLNAYQQFFAKSKKILKNEDFPKLNLMAKIGSKKGIEKEVKKDNSDSSMADLLIKGLSIGSITTEKKINDYKDIVDKDLLDFAKEFLEFQKNAIEKLKEYL